MTTGGDYRRGRHVATALHADMVLATKHRHGVPAGQHLSYLAKMAGEVHADPWAVLAGRNRKNELLRRLIEYPPQLSSSALVNSLKGC